MYSTASAGNAMLEEESGESTLVEAATTTGVGIAVAVVGLGRIAASLVLGRGRGRVATSLYLVLVGRRGTGLVILSIIGCFDGRVIGTGTRRRFAVFRAILLEGFGAEERMATVTEESGVVLVLTSKGEIAAVITIVGL
jgi:hypothetical protein